MTNQLQSRPFAPPTEASPQQQLDLQAQQEKPKTFGHSLANISITNRTTAGRLPIQTKLTIGQPGDKYEQEADKVASQVVNQINSPVTQKSESDNIQREELPEEDELMMKPEVNSIQREELPSEEDELMMKAEAGSIQREELPEEDQLMMKSEVNQRGIATPDLEASIQQARNSGQPLNNEIRTKMESAFGSDFSSVKIHNNAQSDQLNRSIQARAFTTGQDIFFRQGAYNPGSRGGQELLAHELTHVVQQSGKTQSLSPAIQRKMDFDATDLEGSLSKKAKLAGLSGTPSAFSKIKELLVQYSTTDNLLQEMQLLEELKALAESWLEKRLEAPMSRNKRKKADSLNRMLVQLNTELEKISKGGNYLKDLNDGKFEFLTKTGKTAANPNFISIKVKEKAKESGLNEAELAAIKIYTAQDYAYMNPILANNKGWLDFKIKELVKQGQLDLGGRDTLTDKEREQVKKEAMRHSNMVVEGLQKMPDLKKETFRGLGLSAQDFANQYQKGKTVTFPSFSSTSLNRTVAQNFAKQEATGGKVGILLIMQVNKGKDIGDFSLTSSEKEILLPPKASFKVDQIIDQGNNVFEVHLTQIS